MKDVKTEIHLISHATMRALLSFLKKKIEDANQHHKSKQYSGLGNTTIQKVLRWHVGLTLKINTHTHTHTHTQTHTQTHTHTHMHTHAHTHTHTHTIKTENYLLAVIPAK
jgi:hypothetical protein